MSHPKNQILFTFATQMLRAICLHPLAQNTIKIMQKYQRILPVFLAILFLFSCTASPDKTESSTFIDSVATDTSQGNPLTETRKKINEEREKKLKSVDGSYIGMLPCEDCESIKTMVVLNPDNSYLIKKAYQGKKDRTVHETKGTYTYDAISKRITLDGMNGVSYYLFQETHIIQLDKNGKEIKTEKEDTYWLKKSNY
jgi:uncharacterized lipoprotein NlpE involved in copper resistance